MLIAQLQQTTSCTNPTLTASLVPQSMSWALMVNSAAPDGNAAHALPSPRRSEPRRRCLPSTSRPAWNMSACTTTSIESGWHLSTIGRGRTLSSAPRCSPTAGSLGWVLGKVLWELTLSVSESRVIRASIQHEEALSSLRPMLRPEQPGVEGGGGSEPLLSAQLKVIVRDLRRSDRDNV